MTLLTQENDERRVVGFYDQHESVCLDCVDIFRLDIDTFTDLYFKEPLEYTCVYCGVPFPAEEAM
jgi:hypothetical protein